MGLRWGRCSREGVEWNRLCWRFIGNPVSNSTPSLKAEPMRPIHDCESPNWKLGHKRSTLRGVWTSCESFKVVLPSIRSQHVIPPHQKKMPSCSCQLLFIPEIEDVDAHIAHMTAALEAVKQKKAKHDEVMCQEVE